MSNWTKPAQGIKKKKSNELDRPMCTYLLNSSHSVFSLFWRENILVGPGRKYLGPTNFFPSPPSNQTPTKKAFIPIFSPKFSIHPISPPNKHTLKVQSLFIQFYCKNEIGSISLLSQITYLSLVHFLDEQTRA